MLVKCEPDKVRIMDPAANNLVHTVEFSDDRSTRQFLTLFFTGRTQALDNWLSMVPISAAAPHDPKIFHRGDEKNDWVMKHFAGGRPFTFHAHLLLEAAPVVADLEPYRYGLSAYLWDQCVDYLNQA